MMALSSSLTSQDNFIKVLLTAWKRLQQAAPLLELVFFYLERHWQDRLGREEKEKEREKGKENKAQTVPLLYDCWDRLVLQPLEQGEEEGSSARGSSFKLSDWFKLELVQEPPSRELADFCAMYRTLASKHTSACDGLVMEAAAPHALERLQGWWRAVLAQEAKELLEQANLLALLEGCQRLGQVEKARISLCLAGCSPRLARQALRQELLRPLVERLEPALGELMRMPDPRPVLHLLYSVLREHGSLLADLFAALQLAWQERFHCFASADGVIPALLSHVADAQTLWQEAFAADERIKPIMNAAIEAVGREHQLALQGPAQLDRLLQNHDHGEGGGLQATCRLLGRLSGAEAELMASEHYRLLLLRLVAGQTNLEVEGQVLGWLPAREMASCQALLRDQAESASLFAEWQDESGVGVKRPRRRQAPALLLEPERISVFAAKSHFTRSLYLEAVQQTRWPASLLSLEAFTGWYQSRQTGRKLVWSPSLSSVEIGLNGASLVLSLGQLALLEAMPISTASLTASDLNVLQPLLQAGLLHHRQDQFDLNSAYCQSGDLRPTILSSTNTPQAMETTITTSASHDYIDRRGLLAACLVRVVKRAKSIGLASLTQECQVKLSPLFEPTSEDFERELASLVEREYLSRDPKTNLISYLE